MEMLFIFP